MFEAWPEHACGVELAEGCDASVGGQLTVLLREHDCSHAAHQRGVVGCLCGAVLDEVLGCLELDNPLLCVCWPPTCGGTGPCSAAGCAVNLTLAGVLSWLCLPYRRDVFRVHWTPLCSLLSALVMPVLRKSWTEICENM